MLMIQPLTVEQFNKLSKLPGCFGNYGFFEYDNKSINIITGYLHIINKNYELANLIYYDYTKEWYEIALSFLKENNPDLEISLVFNEGIKE